MAPAPKVFSPALLIVDVQEDFCPPNGSLAVPNGRDIIPTVNKLLHLPFTIKVATKDWHPRNHISFASNHPAPSNVAFESKAIIVHPSDSSRTYETLLWPDHCVQNTLGAELLSELNVDQVDKIINKGDDPRLEMYSAFTDPFHEAPFTSESTSVCTSELPRILGEKGVTHVYVVGLAQDYCVRDTALDSVKFGYVTFVIREGTKAVDPEEGWRLAEKKMVEAGIRFVGIDGEEVEWLKL